MKLGITGSRNGLTLKQKATAMNTMGSFAQKGVEEVHHGCCVGADYLIHQLAKWLDLPLVLHPPKDQKLMVPILRDAIRQNGISCPVREPIPYLDRNRAIVDESDVLLVLPEGPERQRSGTWSTYRYALSQNKNIWVITPEGTYL